MYYTDRHANTHTHTQPEFLTSFIIEQWKDGPGYITYPVYPSSIPSALFNNKNKMREKNVASILDVTLVYRELCAVLCAVAT